MNNKFKNLIEQSYSLPAETFKVADNQLFFNNIDLKSLAQHYGTPLRISYLPKIGEQIEKARVLFQSAMNKHDYKQDYIFSYCTKSSHFAHILKEALAHKSQIELSSAFDTEIVLRLFREEKLSRDTYILCNGYKTAEYFAGIQRMLHAGFTNVIPILDCMSELKVYESFDAEEINIGIRMATEEEPDFDFYTSRFGIRKSAILDFYRYRLHKHPKIKLKMLHFFVYTGLQDTAYFWNELNKYLKIYGELQQLCPHLDSLNIGGGLPIQNALEFEYDYQYMVDELIGQIKEFCVKKAIDEPYIFSEFGSYTVGESGAVIYKVLGTKRQNDREIWYIIDNSIINNIPDMWAKKQKFILLPINQWGKEYQRAVLGGLTCDNDDYFNRISANEELFLPIIDSEDIEPLYLGFFHTGAYQETLSGYGGIQHCLVPTPKHILIDEDEEGQLTYEVFSPEQKAKDVLNILGY